MRTISFAAALVAACASTLVPALGATPAAVESTMTVTGVGVISRTPDRAFVSVGVVTNDDVAARALSANNARYNDLVARVSAAGVPASDIRTTGLTTVFNRRPQEPNPGVAARYGYVVSRYLRITIDALTATGAVIDAAAAAGAESVGGVSYGFRDSAAVGRAALAAAVADAFEQARAIADAAHVRIVRVRQIAANGASAPPPVFAIGRTLAAAPAPPVPTVVPPSDLDTRATVTVTYVVAP